MSSRLSGHRDFNNSKGWIKVGNVYLPESILLKSRTPPDLPVVEVITAEEVLGNKGNEQAAIELCQSMFWKDCVLYASRIGAFLEKYGAVDIETQQKLSGLLFRGDSQNRVNKFLQSSRGVVRRALFNSWQLLMFTKMALLYGSDDTKLNLDDRSRLQVLGDCLLTINDLIGLGSKGEMRHDDAYLVETLIRNGAFFAREEAGNLLPRYYDLFSIVPKYPELKESPNYMDIESVFRRITGFDLDLFLALGFGVYSYYVPAEDFHANKFVLTSSTFFSKTLVPDEAARKLISFISISRDKYREKHIAKYGEGNLGNYFDFTLFRQRPLVRLDDNIYVPVDTRFVVERVTASVYWDICDGLYGQERHRFMRFFGDILQKYVERLFRRVYPETLATVRRTFYDVSYNGKRASDIILFYGEEAVFMDVVVGRLRMEETMITGDSKAFIKDIGNKVVDTAKQIDRVIRDFMTEELSLPGWSPKNIRCYYPVVVTVSPLPVFLKTYDMVRQIVADAGHLRSDYIADLEVVSIGELEIIEPLLEGGYALVKILANKNQDKFYRRVPLWHYLHATIGSRTLRTGGGYFHKRRDEMFNRIGGLLFDTDIAQVEKK